VLIHAGGLPGHSGRWQEFFLVGLEWVKNLFWFSSEIFFGFLPNVFVGRVVVGWKKLQ